MNTYIKSVAVDLFNGIFNTVINFSNGLNIVSGVNGSGKTQLLKLIKDNKGTASEDKKNSADLAILAISPKRNTEKQTIDSIFQQVKTQDKTVQSFINNIKGWHIRDTGFENYPSFAELFIQEYNSLMQDGVTGYEKAIALTSNKFNEVLGQVFPDYQIEASWVSGQVDLAGRLDLRIKKYDSHPITIDQLSTGEREVFALLFCIFVSRDKEDVYLIDEPEIHLNWDLERGLFGFFEWFCNKFGKQIIVVTHSRIIFRPEFYGRTQFLVWENSKIICKKEISEKQKSSIAGEVSNIVNIMDSSKPIFFVEDNQHKLFVAELASVLGKDVEVIVCGNKTAVKAIFEMLKNSTSGKTYFLTDGDNESSKIVDERFIHLQKYCIENYLFDPYILSKIFSTDEANVKQKVIDCVKDLTHQNLIVYKKVAENLTPFPFEILDTLDCSKISEKLAQKFGQKTSEIVGPYIRTAHTEDRLDSIFGELTVKIKS